MMVGNAKNLVSGDQTLTCGVALQKRVCARDQCVR